MSNAVILKAFFWPKDLPQCFSLKCSLPALTKNGNVHGPRSQETEFSSKRSGEILRAKEALQDDKTWNIGEST